MTGKKVIQNLVFISFISFHKFPNNRNWRKEQAIRTKRLNPLTDQLWEQQCEQSCSLCLEQTKVADVVQQLKIVLRESDPRMRGHITPKKFLHQQLVRGKEVKPYRVTAVKYIGPCIKAHLAHVMHISK